MTPVVLHTGPLRVNTVIVPLGEGRALIVDPAACSFSGDESVIVDYLQDNALIPVAIVLTHGHFDHVSALPFLKKQYPQLPILIHEKDAACIGAQSQRAQELDLAAVGFSAFLPAVSALPEPTAFLRDNEPLSEALHTADEALTAWTVLHTPGHTQGSCCLYNEKEKLLLSGDTLFYMSWGRTDLTGGSEQAIQQSLRRIVSTCAPDTRVYPGHDRTGFLLSDMLR